MANLADLEEQLGYTFNDMSLLSQALTHRSYGRLNNERLEFVGDGILDYVIALNLYRLYPELCEGDLSKMRAALVNQDGLFEIADLLNLGAYLLLGDGELKSGGRKRPSILADCLEALFAAISLDSNFERCAQVIERLFYYRLREQEQGKTKDYKTLLQEFIQAKHMKLPNYQIVKMTGPEHDMVFSVECTIEELNLSAIGIGKGKKQASQLAAQNLLNLLKESKLNAK